MAGYVVSTRVERARLRRGHATWYRSAVLPDKRTEADQTVTTEDLVGRPLEVLLGERWEEIRRVWAQTTFYLFDPESWR